MTKTHKNVQTFFRWEACVHLKPHFCFIQKKKRIVEFDAFRVFVIFFKEVNADVQVSAYLFKATMLHQFIML